MKLILAILLFASAVQAQHTAMVSVSFADSTNPPPTVSSMTTQFTNAAAFHLENSYGLKVLSAEYFGPVTVNVTGCDTAGIRDQVNQQLGLFGYDVLIYALAYRSSCGWAGVALRSSGAVPRVYLNGNSTVFVSSHELGHSYGLHHSSSLTSETGDRYDVMGSALHHMNAYQKMRLGVLIPTTIVVSGQYMLLPIESDASALKVLKSVDDVTGDPTYYYIEYRRSVGYDSSVPPGVLVHQGTEFQSSFNLFFSYILTAPMGVGSFFYDPNNRIRITPLAEDSNQAVVEVVFDAEPPPTPTPTPTPVPTPTPSPTPCVRLPNGKCKKF